MNLDLAEQLPQAILEIVQVLIHAQPVGWFAIGLIILYLAFTTYRTIVLQQKLDEEHLALRRLAEQMDGLSSDDQENDELGNALIRDYADDTLAYRMLSGLMSIRRLSNPSLEPIRDQVRGQYLPRLSALRAVPNTLLLIGLFGTVAGLGTTVASLAPQLSNALFAANPQELTRGLGATLQEMQTAFAATLWGILAAVAMSFVVRNVAGKHHYVTSYASTLLAERLAPILMVSSTEAQLEDIRRVLQDSREHMQGVSGIMQEAASNFEGVLERTGKGMTESIDQLATVSQTMQAALEKLLGDVQSSAKSLRSSTDDMRSSTEQLGAFHQDMRNAYVEMNGLFREAQENADRRSQEQLERVEDLQIQFGSASDNVIKSLNSLQQDLSASSRSFDEIEQRYINSTNQVLAKVGGGFESLDERLTHLLEAHNREMSEAAQRLGTINESFNDLAERMNPALLPKEEWKQILLHLSEIGPELSSSRETVQTTISAVPEQLTSRLMEHYEPLLEMQRQIAVRIAQNGDMSKHIQETLTGIRNDLKSLPISFPKESEQREGSEVGIDNMPDRSQTLP